MTNAGSEGSGVSSGGQTVFVIKQHGLNWCPVKFQWSLSNFAISPGDNFYRTGDWERISLGSHSHFLPSFGGSPFEPKRRPGLPLKSSVG